MRQVMSNLIIMVTTLHIAKLTAFTAIATIAAQPSRTKLHYQYPGHCTSRLLCDILLCIIVMLMLRLPQLLWPYTSPTGDG